jgi:hypothetical protein
VKTGIDASNAFRRHLAAHRPHDAILGEEFGAHGQSERVWMIASAAKGPRRRQTRDG